MAQRGKPRKDGVRDWGMSVQIKDYVEPQKQQAENCSYFLEHPERVCLDIPWFLNSQLQKLRANALLSSGLSRDYLL